MDRILITCGGSINVAAVTPEGQANGTNLNYPGQSLHEALRKHEGKLIVIFDALFGTGYHRVYFGCSAEGHGWTYRLEPLMPLKEITENKSHLAKAFNQLECKINQPPW